MLRQATLDEKRARDVLTWPEWGARLTVEQYLKREQRLRNHRWARERMTTWFWTGHRVGEVLASCETFRMDSLVGGELHGSSWGIASVFTEPSLRGRGYASEMMRALVKRLCDEPQRHAAILFSDVGAPIYERAGFVARDGRDRVWPALDGDPAEAVDALFREDELPDAWAATWMPRDPFLIWPSAAQLDWHLERERIYAELLGAARPPAWGARAGESRAFWMGDLKNGRLMVLLFSGADPDEAVALIRSARRCAHAAGLSEVRMYEVPVPFEWPSVEGGRLEPRQGELAMIAPLWNRIRPEGWRQAMRALWI